MAVTTARHPRNAPCPCGSGRKHKQCCGCKRLEHSPGKGLTHSPAMIVTLPVLRETQGIPTYRACGGCQACCGPALFINDPDLVKPPGKHCRNLCTEGCAIWGEDMPATCSGYLCNYLVEPGNLSIADRPDQIGAIVRLARLHGCEPPMDRVTYVNECAPGGLWRILDNDAWGPVIQRDLRQGVPLLCSWVDDPLSFEVLHVHLSDERLRCELAVCDEEGQPVRITAQPILADPIEMALMPPQRFAFDAEILADQVGQRGEMTIAASTSTTLHSQLRFRMTQRQARLVRRLRRLIDAPD